MTRRSSKRAWVTCYKLLCYTVTSVSPVRGNSGIMTVLGPGPDRAASSYAASILALFSLISCCLSRINFSFASPKPITIAGGVGEEDPLDDADAGAFGIIGAVGGQKRKRDGLCRDKSLVLHLTSQVDIFLFAKVKVTLHRVTHFARKKRKEGKSGHLHLDTMGTPPEEPNVHEPAALLGVYLAASSFEKFFKSATR